jgi:hypothetical protein
VKDEFTRPKRNRRRVSRCPSVGIAFWAAGEPMEPSSPATLIPLILKACFMPGESTKAMVALLRSLIYPVKCL